MTTTSPVETGLSDQGTPLSKPMSATFLLITVLVVAASLRAAITSVGPVLGLIATDTHHSKSVLGLLELCLRSKDLPDKSRTLIERSRAAARPIEASSAAPCGRSRCIPTGITGLWRGQRRF